MTSLIAIGGGVVVGREVAILTEEADFQVLLLWERLGTRGMHRHQAQASPPHRRRSEHYRASASLAPTPQGDTPVPQESTGTAATPQTPSALSAQAEEVTRRPGATTSEGRIPQRTGVPPYCLHCKESTENNVPHLPRGFPGLQDSESG